MVDYVLTVAVSISAGVAAIISIPALSGLADHRVELGVGLILLITLMNMRGIKESGTIFAIPTYLYMLVFGGAHHLRPGPFVHRRHQPDSLRPELAETSRRVRRHADACSCC